MYLTFERKSMETNQLAKKYGMEVAKSSEEITRDMVLQGDASDFIIKDDLTGTQFMPFVHFEEAKNELFQKGKGLYDAKDAMGMHKYAIDVRDMAVYAHKEFSTRLDSHGQPMSAKYFDVSYIGGVAPVYHEMVNNYVEYKHMAVFWFMLSHSLESGDNNPVFNFHAEYIGFFSNMLPMDKALSYLFGIKSLLLEKKDDLPDMGRDFVLASVNQMIANKKEILETAVDVAQLKEMSKSLEERNGDQ